MPWKLKFPFSLVLRVSFLVLLLLMLECSIFYFSILFWYPSPHTNSHGFQADVVYFSEIHRIASIEDGPNEGFSWSVLCILLQVFPSFHYADGQTEFTLRKIELEAVEIIDIQKQNND